MSMVLRVGMIKFSSLQTLLDVNVEGIIPTLPTCSFNSCS